jgi:hypothetical protein
MKDKARLGFFLLALLAGGVLISVAYRFSREELIVDQCLSGKHGSFDYSKMSCDLQENHIYVPYRIRHPHDRRIAIVSLVTFTAFVLGHRYVTVSNKKQ